MHLERVETMILRFVNVTSARWWKRTTARRGRLLSLDPTSKKTVSSSRLITVLASKQPALLRDFKGCTGAGGVAIAKACTGGREGGERKGEREGRDERVPRQQLRVRFHQLTYSTLYWMATPNSKRHPHPPKSHVFRIFSAHPITPSRFFNFNYIISTYRYISIYILSFPMWCSTRKNNAFSRLGKNRSKNIRFAQLNRFRIINAFSS